MSRLPSNTCLVKMAGRCRTYFTTSGVEVAVFVNDIVSHERRRKRSKDWEMVNAAVVCKHVSGRLIISDMKRSFGEGDCVQPPRPRFPFFPVGSSCWPA